MLGDDQAVGKSARARFEQSGGTRDGFAILDFQIQADNTITARRVLPDARRIRGLLKSPHAAPLTVEQMDEAVAKQLRDKHAPTQAGRKSTGR